MRHAASFTLTFIILVSISIYTSGRNPAEGWKAGVVKTKITPAENIWMAGYASRTKPAESILHDLWAKALFLQDSTGNTALLITTDMLGFTREITKLIHKRLESEMGLKSSQIILSSSHSHSGPVLTNALITIYPLDDVQKEKINKYTSWLTDQIIELAVKAKGSMKPVNIYSSNGEVRVQVNRRNNNERQITEITELKGPNDFAVPVLKVENKKGKIEAVVFGYACHPTVLSGYQWSGDYPGFAQLELEKKYKGATAMFFQGGGADQNPLPRRSVALAKQYGLELAAAVERVLSEKMKKQRSDLFTSYSEIDLELETPPSKTELIKLSKEFEGYRKAWCDLMLGKIEKGEQLITSYPYPVQFWKIGDQNLVSLGGELLINYTISLKKILGEDTFVMGYANDVMTYIPGEKALTEGGYEVDDAHMVYNLPSKWKPGLEKKIINEVVRLAKQSGKVSIRYQ